MKLFNSISSIKYIKRTVKYGAVSIFIIYWFLTILYCTPDNFIKIKMYKVLNTLGMLFPQQWSFFAPPPTFNIRLYFSYYDKDRDLINTVEVMSPIIKSKQKNAPFNFNDQIIDYSVSSTIITLNAIIVQQKNIFQIRFKDSTELACSEMAKREVSKFANKLTEVKTLLNYSKIVLKNQRNRMNNAKFVKITITQIDIPKFEDRHLLLQTNRRTKQEGLLFNSELLNL